jgi:two-component system NtrC family sensor kinase
MSSSSVESAIRYLAISALVQAIVLITIAVPITYIVAQRFTRPIKTLAKAAESVGAGSLDDDLLPVYKQNDEIGDLNVAFAGMVEALRESRRKLERAQERNLQSAKMVAVDKLANGVTREINNPLAAILGFAQLGKQKLAKVDGKMVDAEEISYLDRYLGFVETEAKRCGQIISRMLSFTLSPEQDMVPTDVNLLVEQVIKMNINQLGQSGVTPVFELAEGLSKVNGELTSLIRVFDHVLLNAVKAMPNGGTLRVSTCFRPGLPSAGLCNGQVVEFQDTGKGISRENIAKVFDPFFTTDEPGRGTGLGLYVSYQIIKQHGADIEITSDLGEGTTVTITFPELVPVDEAKDARLPVEWI